jgi:hypothetical protein
VAERDLSCVAGQQHQGDRADRREQDLVCQIEQERAGDEGEGGEHDAEDRKPDLLRAGIE